MKTELLTFETTVRVTYDSLNPKARAAALNEARFLLNQLSASSNGRRDNRGNPIEVGTVRSVYKRPTKSFH